MPRTTENGWPVIPSAGLCYKFVKYSRTWYFASHDVAYLFAYLLTQYNDRVERIDLPNEKTPDDWSWSPARTIAGSTTLSNHDSGTAADFNATKHPRGVAIGRTFSVAQVKTILSILATIVDAQGSPVIRWGGQYTKSPVDGMHFEINTDAVGVRQARLRLEKLEESALPSAADVWAADVIPVTDTATAKTNPTWSGANALGRVFDNTQGLKTQVATMQNQVDTLAGEVSGLIDAVNALKAELTE